MGDAGKESGKYHTVEWSAVVERCVSLEECARALEEYLSSLCPDRSKCERPYTSKRKRLLEKYSWVEKVIESGVPDGRSRLILYVISRYLLNVKNLDEQEAFNIIKDFLNNSCEKHGQCKKIYDSWIRNVLRHVKRGGWKPWSLERISREDPELYKVLENILGKE